MNKKQHKDRILKEIKEHEDLIIFYTQLIQDFEKKIKIEKNRRSHKLKLIIEYE